MANSGGDRPVAAADELSRKHRHEHADLGAAACRTGAAEQAGPLTPAGTAGRRSFRGAKRCAAWLSWPAAVWRVQMVRPARPVERPKTQEERLAEAAETEKLNLASLEAFQKREEERKRANKRVTTCVERRKPSGMPLALD